MRDRRGTVISRIDIARAVDHGTPYRTLVRPGDEIRYASAAGRRSSACCGRSTLSKRSVSIPLTPPWRCLHNRLVAGEPPRAYSRIAGWLLRRRLAPRRASAGPSPHAPLHSAPSFDVPSSAAQADLERQRERADRPLRGASGQRPAGRRAVTVDGITMATRANSRGRPLTAWQGCQRIPDGDVFLMNRQPEDYFDGRYFGHLPVTAIVDRADPL
jgi:Signal peptidase, peptidase S26